MSIFTNQGVFNAGGSASLSGLIDLEIALINGQWRLYSASESNFGLGAFTLNGTGALSALDALNYGASSGTLGVTQINISNIGGVDVLIPTGRYDNRIALHSLDSAGQFDTSTGPSGGPGAVNRTASINVGGTTYAFVAELNGNGFSTYQIPANLQMSYLTNRVDTAFTHIGDITDLVTTSAFGKSFLFASSGFDAGVTVYTVGTGGTLSEHQSIGATSGLGIAAPSDMATAQIGSDLFLLLASAQSNSLTVFDVSKYGRLQVVDHLTDNGETVLEDVSSVETVNFDGRTFVLAGGAEGGVSLFELLPLVGRLKFIESLADTETLSLQGVTDIEAEVIGGQVHVYVSSSSEDGITTFTLDIGDNDAPLVGTKHSDTITGTWRNDLILGLDRNDTLSGWGGNDKLVDGTGADVLIGGAGADVFCFVVDEMVDTIDDFTPGTDKIDLSETQMLYSISQIDLVEQDWGVLLVHGRDRIKLLDNARGGDLDVTDILESDFVFS